MVLPVIIVAKDLCLKISDTSAQPVRNARPERRRFFESVRCFSIVDEEDDADAENNLLLLVVGGDFNDAAFIRGFGL